MSLDPQPSAVLMAEVVNNYFPKIVELHNYRQEAVLLHGN